MMFIGLNQVYYLRFECNTHNNYNYIIKTKWNYNQKLFTTEQIRRGFGVDRVLIKREALILLF